MHGTQEELAKKQKLHLYKSLFSMKKKIWYECQRDNSTQETKVTQILTTISHRMAFNNEQSPYRIVRYKRPRNYNVKQCKREN